MPYPSEPNKIILNNTNAKTLYEYYISVKDKIIKECDRRPVLLFNKYDNSSDFVVVRNYKDNKIILNKDNYEEIITGYTVSISVESAYPGQRLKQILIDIDSRNPKIKEDDLKTCVYELLELYKHYKCYITNSSTGYHFRVDINPQVSSKVLALTINELTKNLSKKYSINARQRGGMYDSINLDLVAMQSRGSLTVPYSLNRNLSICSYISPEKLPFFSRNSSFLNKF